MAKGKDNKTKSNSDSKKSKGMNLETAKELTPKKPKK